MGDDAIFARTRHGHRPIFRKGDAAFDFRVYDIPNDQAEAKEEELAQDVLGRL